VFGQLILAHRKRLGLTQEELAERTGLGVRTVRYLEAGRGRRPRLASVRLLAEAFDLHGAEREHFQQLASGSDDPTSDPTSHAPAARPAQLPADVAAFTGRRAELAWLDGALTGDVDPNDGTAVVISAVSGTAGVGKTALAVRWAHGNGSRFPDGQLYVDLRGYDPDRPLTATEALVRFVTSLGVPSRDAPIELDALASTYRTLVAGRRILILLDNAAGVEQVRPLLPGTPSCAVVVTSRDSLSGLVARHGARRLDLDLLPADDAILLLRRLIGARVEADPAAADLLAAQCARLPLALRVAAELAISRPSMPLADLAAELADHRRRLNLLDGGGDPRAAVAAVFSWSVRQLPPDTARAFALLGLHPGPDFDAYATAALANNAVEPARRHLEVLARAHLVHQTTTGRYGMHDLLRAYAGQLVGAESDGYRRLASGRLFDHYLGTAAAAMDALYPAERHRRPRVDPPGTPIPDVSSPAAARQWLDGELPCLVSTTAYTAAHGWREHCVRLSTTLFRYLAGGHFTDALAIFGHGRDAARETGDPVGEAEALFGLGTVHARLGNYELATDHLHRALELFRRSGHPVGQARTLGNLGAVAQRLDEFAQAIDYHEQALALFRQTGDEVGAGRALNNVGEIKARMGRYEAAVEHHREALELHSRTGERAGQAAALTNLGEVAARTGRHEAAIEHHKQALAVYRSLGHRSGEAWALDSIGTVYTSCGQPARASGYHQRALRLFRDIGEQDGEMWALNGLGEAACAAGRVTDALAHHAAAEAIAVRTGTRWHEARAHAGLGRACDALGDGARARQHHERALALYTELSAPEAEDVRARLEATANGR
jgi:tetratricopeptide (TPR) repeat protein/transcriptional regulator with XRE-family HTH domain